MTSFAHVDYPAQHPGVERAERTVAAVRDAAARFDGARASATLLLAAIVAALVVVANQVVETWTEGHLLAAWIVLWTVAFAGLALLAAPARGAARSLGAGWSRLLQARREAAADRELLALAASDPRVMADIRVAATRQDARDLRWYF